MFNPQVPQRADEAQAAGIRDFRNVRRRLFPLARSHRGQLIGGLLAVILGTAAMLGGTMAVRYLVDAIVPGGDPETLTEITLLLVMLFGAQAGFRMISAYWLALVGERAVANLRTELYNHLLRLSMSFYGKRRTGDLVSRMTDDVAMLRGLFSTEIAMGLSQALLFFGALALILVTDWRLTLLMLVLVPVVSLFAVIFGKRLRRLSVAVQDKLAAATAVLEEALNGMPVVQSFQRERHESQRYADSVETAFDHTRKRVRLGAAFGPGITFLFLGVTLCVLWYGGKEVLAGEMTTGQLITFLVLTMMLASAIGQIAGLWSRLQMALGASRRLFEILDTHPEVVEVVGAKELTRAEGRITFEGVWFTYEPRQKDRYSLRHLDLDVQPGEILAVVGPSGAGKTTLINLIPRFYNVSQGTLRIDGHNVRTLSLESLRRQIAIVPQETYLFAGTVYENLAYGKLDATRDEIIAVAEAANAHEFIEKMTHGYDTIVGPRGTRLSGGQRQRVSIARALLKDPRILLLDEATSSLDSESEGLVKQALARLMKGRTSVVVAHRLSTIQNADRIAVLNNGRLMEIGSHDELLAADGLYARLFYLQFEKGDQAELIDTLEGTPVA